jgi:hypothetical protein
MCTDEKTVARGTIVAVDHRGLVPLRTHRLLDLLSSVWRTRTLDRAENNRIDIGAKIHHDATNAVNQHSGGNEVDVAAVSLADAICGAICDPISNRTGSRSNG